MENIVGKGEFACYKQFLFKFGRVQNSIQTGKMLITFVTFTGQKWLKSC